MLQLLCCWVPIAQLIVSLFQCCGCDSSPVDHAIAESKGYTVIESDNGKTYYYNNCTRTYSEGYSTAEFSS